jgi:drug/metabolite transporter (DMT)-like permease
MKSTLLKMNSTCTKAYLALLVVYLVWGTTMGAIHIGVETIHPALLVCLRFTVAGLLLLLYCFSRGERLPDNRSLFRDCMVGFLLFVGGNSAVSWALQYVPTGLAGALVATNPFWMVALSAVTPPHEHVRPLDWIGLVIGFMGMLVLLSPELLAPQQISPVYWISIIGLLVMVFFWAAGTVYARKTETRSSLLMSLGIQNLFSGVLLIPVCGLTPHALDFTPSTGSLMALIYLILMGTILATSCYLFLLKHLTITVAGTFAYVTPVITVIFGWLFLGESLTSTTMLGTGIIIAGVLMIQLFSQKPAVRTTPCETPREAHA